MDLTALAEPSLLPLLNQDEIAPGRDADPSPLHAQALILDKSRDKQKRCWKRQEVKAMKAPLPTRRIDAVANIAGAPPAGDAI